MTDGHMAIRVSTESKDAAKGFEPFAISLTKSPVRLDSVNPEGQEACGRGDAYAPRHGPSEQSPEEKTKGEKAVTYKQINLKLEDALWLAAKIKAAQNRMFLSEAIRKLLREWTAKS